MEVFDKICRLAADNSDLADFLLVYIEEAHPTDGWMLSFNKIQISHHRCIEDRLAAAAKLPSPLRIPVVADAMSNNAMHAYGALPERLYIIRKGVVEYQGYPGPFIFYPADVDNWLKRYRDGPSVTDDNSNVDEEVRRRANVKGNARQ